MVTFLPADTCLSFLNEDLLTKMANASVSCCLRDLTLTIAKGIFLTVVLPIAPALLFNIPVPSVLALIASTFVIEYGAAAAGIGMGLPPLYVLYAVTCIALGVTVTLFDIFDLLGRHSDRVTRVFGKVFRTGRSFSVFEKVWDLWPRTLCHHPWILCLSSGVPGDGVAQEQVNFVDYGRIYRHIPCNYSCDNRIF